MSGSTLSWRRGWPNGWVVSSSYGRSAHTITSQPYPTALDASCGKVRPRTPLPPGIRVCVDEPRWLPAVASCVRAAHLAASDRETLWQALAGGSAVSCGHAAALPVAELAAAAPALADATDVLRRWREYRDNPIAARAAGDAARRAFWQERPRAAEVSTELLDRVFEWN